jgi:imidazole glycerol-phosphate synthase subunit HisH
MIAVVNYGIEKNHPLIKLLSKLKIDFKVTHNESEILHSDKVILPNTDSIASAVKQLHLLNLFTMLRLYNKPMLGISVGMHLMSAYTIDGNLSCLGIFPGTAERIDEENKSESSSNLSEVILIKECKLFNNIKGEEFFFFDNAYCLPVEQYTSAIAGDTPIFSAALEKENFFGVQFLPEKSGEAGSQLLKNFIGL